MMPIDFLSMIKQGQNPQQLILAYLQNNSTPFGENLLKLAKENNVQEIEKIARNFCASQGRDFDTEFRAFKQQLGLK